MVNERAGWCRQQLAAAYASDFRFMELSVTASDDVAPLEFTDVFVLLHVTASNGETAAPSTIREGKELDPKQVPIIARREQRHVMIKADAGWGKSTLLRDLARTQDDEDACGFAIVHADLRALLDAAYRLHCSRRTCPPLSALHRGCHSRRKSFAGHVEQATTPHGRCGRRLPAHLLSFLRSHRAGGVAVRRARRGLRQRCLE